MFLVRDVFHCKPGKAKDLAERFKRLTSSLEEADGFTNVKVMVDAVADYWTVVLEAEVDSLDRLERHMNEFSQRAEVREVMAGYMDLVNGGRREIYRVL
jgi:heme-degrading monooxygenase HmoA